MEIFPKNIEEAMKIIYDILNQDDSRYNNTWNEQDLSLFLINKAIVLEEREIPNLKEPEKDELDHIYGVQKEEKYIAKFF